MSTILANSQVSAKKRLLPGSAPMHVAARPHKQPRPDPGLTAPEPIPEVRREVDVLDEDSGFFDGDDDDIDPDVLMQMDLGPSYESHVSRLTRPLLFASGAASSSLAKSTGQSASTSIPSSIRQPLPQLNTPIAGPSTHKRAVDEARLARINYQCPN